MSIGLNGLLYPDVHFYRLNHITPNGVFVRLGGCAISLKYYTYKVGRLLTLSSLVASLLTRWGRD